MDAKGQTKGPGPGMTYKKQHDPWYQPLHHRVPGNTTLHFQESVRPPSDASKRRSLSKGKRWNDRSLAKWYHRWLLSGETVEYEVSQSWNAYSESHKAYVDVILHGLPSRCLRDDAVPYFSESAGHDGCFEGRNEREPDSLLELSRRIWNSQCVYCPIVFFSLRIIVPSALNVKL